MMQGMRRKDRWQSIWKATGTKFYKVINLKIENDHHKNFNKFRKNTFLTKDHVFTFLI